jgi:hypothetical protein
MRAVIHQPEYLPWLGFFDKLQKCDLFILLDHVQFQKGFINRNKIKTSTGWKWLTIPIVHKFHRAPINVVKIKNEINWKIENWRAIEYNYVKSPYFKDFGNLLKEVFETEWEMLVDIDVYLLQEITKFLSIKTPIIKSSSLNAKGSKTELLVNICQEVNADIYLSGQGGKNYMDIKLFEDKNIRVEFQNFNHPRYKQQFEEKGFEPGMSIIDLIFNIGPKSMDIIKEAN